MENVISIWHIRIVDPSKMTVFPSFQVTKGLNSKNKIWNWDSEWNL